jgi:hypothetical protein
MKSLLICISVILSIAIANNVHADSIYWGQWETKKDAKPNIQIEIKRKKQTQVVIDGQLKSMDYSVAEGKHGHLLLEFYQGAKNKSGNESEINIYLIGGRIGNDFVLQGFYFSIDHNEEGVERDAKTIPITLYLIKRYKWKD